ncbi:hypothetical protein [Clostridium baratii]|uniref:hypothetical protein n=1 Tax=Clostridium baratii TaxID=1561 RepID=UPI0005F284B5|nr:hypothetical protein [Clostridium baratii]KJU71638.1 hypothetical protein UC77_08450 [Clostridium baratii]
MKLKNILNKERIYNNANFIKLIFFVIFILKTIIFLKVGTSEGGRSFDGWSLPNNTYTIIEYLSLLAILIFPSFICKGKKQLRYLLIIDCLYSILLIADLWYYRASRYYLEVLGIVICVAVTYLVRYNVDIKNITKVSKVIGNLTEEDREKLKEAYKIAEYIINNDYFVNRGLVH